MTDLTARSAADRAHADYASLQPVDPDARPVAVLIAGGSGCGKSTLAESLARRLRAPVFSMDWLLGALVPFRVMSPDEAPAIAEVQVTAAAARQLQLGLSVIIDATGHTSDLRGWWRVVVEGRSRGIPGWPGTVAWEHVLRMRELWEPWVEPHLVVDSAVDSIEVGVRRVLGAVSGDWVGSWSNPDCAEPLQEGAIGDHAGPPADGCPATEAAQRCGAPLKAPHTATPPPRPAP